MRQQSIRLRNQRQRRARAAQVRRYQMMIAAVFMSIVFIVCFIIFGMTTDASTETDGAFKYYTDVMITCDRGIDEIAEEYADEVHYTDADEYIDEVCTINHFKTAAEAYSVRPGDHIVVPYFSEEFK